jgi:hypothetical protein
VALAGEKSASAAMTKRPAWVTPWGVIAIVIGVWGVLAGAGAMLTPRALQMQRAMMQQMFEAQTQHAAEAPDEEASRRQARDAEAARAALESMMNALALTRELERWLVASGAIGAALSGVYIFGAALVLQLRALGKRVFLAAAGGKIALALVGLLVVRAPDGLGALLLLPGALIGVVVHGVMLGLLLAGARDLAPREAGFETH